MEPAAQTTLRQRSAAALAHPSTPEKSSTSSSASSHDDDASSILSSSVQGASYLVLLQFVSRMLTFTLNQVLLRFTSAEILGIASVQLELLLNTILFLSREGVRCAAIRVSDDDDGQGNKDDQQAGKEEEKDKGRVIKTTKASSEAYRLQKLVNMVYAPIPVGALMTCLAVGYSLNQIDSESEAKFPGYRLSIYLYGISALIELLAEPMFMVAQYKLWFKTRVSVEGTAVVARCVLTCLLTIYGAKAAAVANEVGSGKEGHGGVVAVKNTMGVLAFAVAQFVYAMLTLGGFLVAFWRRSSEKLVMERSKLDGLRKKGQEYGSDSGSEHEQGDVISIRALLPRKLVKTGKNGRQESFYFDKELLKLSKTLTAQSLLKHILTEGDKMLMAKFTAEEAQGVYAFVINYGSLIARILFQPMEETSRTLFSRLLSDIVPAKTTSKVATTTLSTDSAAQGPSTKLSETQLKNLTLSRNLLLTIMKFHIFLGLIFIAFGTHYTATLIDLVVGRYWSRSTIAPQVLALYCYYVPIMGLNGITEAVVQAVASEQELGILSYWMVAFSAVFCTVGAVLMGGFDMGAKGIVLANCVNLTMRILWSTWFLSGYYGRHLPLAGSAFQAESSGKDVEKRKATGWVASIYRTYGAVPWETILPKPIVWATFGLAFVITAVSEQWIGWDRLMEKGLHISVGVGCFAVVGGVILTAEKAFLREIQNVVRQRRQ